MVAAAVTTGGAFSTSSPGADASAACVVRPSRRCCWRTSAMSLSPTLRRSARGGTTPLSSPSPQLPRPRLPPAALVCLLSPPLSGTGGRTVGGMAAWCGAPRRAPPLVAAMARAQRKRCSVTPRVARVNARRKYAKYKINKQIKTLLTRRPHPCPHAALCAYCCILYYICCAALCAAGIPRRWRCGKGAALGRARVEPRVATRYELRWPTRWCIHVLYTAAADKRIVVRCRGRCMAMLDGATTLPLV